MAKSEQQRQKQLAKKRAKEQRKQRELSRQKQQMASKSGQMLASIKYPIYACLASTTVGRPTESDEEVQGMGTVIVARQLPGGSIAFVAFLIDAWCLGVKDLVIRQVTRSDFGDFVEKVRQNEPLGKVEPSYARKLTERAVEYAKSIGFQPAGDYSKASLIWGDVDPDACATEFVFGHEGKPYYFAGPHDDLAKQNRICNTLLRNVGKDNFHFTLPVPPSAMDLPWADEDEVRSIEASMPE